MAHNQIFCRGVAVVKSVVVLAMGRMQENGKGGRGRVRGADSGGRSSAPGRSAGRNGAVAAASSSRKEAVKVVEPESDSSDMEDEEEEENEEGSNEQGSEEDQDEGHSDDSDEFEEQGSSTDDDSEVESADDAASSDDLEDAVEGNAATKTAESLAGRSFDSLRYREAELMRAMKNGSLAVQTKMHADDLSSDDDEGEQNTIGRVPLHWYDAYDHIGYDVTGKKVLKRAAGDRIDAAINSSDPKSAAGRTVYDMYNDREVVLSERDLEIIRRIQGGAFAHAEHDDTPDYIDYNTYKTEVMPISSAPEPKRRFAASKWEMMRVMKIVKAIKEGRYVDSKEALEKKKAEEDTLGGLFMIWNDQEDETLANSRRYAYHLPAPKIPLPGHAESYNPPAEYLLSEQERKEYEEMDPSERPYDFIPKKHSCLRHVGAYGNLVKERFERCLDLYLCPRQLKKRLNIDPESLIPRLPKPKELKPFPNSLCLQYVGHKKAVRSVSVSPDGQYIVSGSDDGTVMLWEVDTCLCRYVWDFAGVPISAVAWNPNPSHAVIAVALGSRIVFITTGMCDADSVEVTESLLEATVAQAALGAPAEDAEEDAESDGDGDDGPSDKKKKKSAKLAGLFKWTPVTTAAPDRNGKVVGPRVELVFPQAVESVSWHHKGDYFAVLSPTAGAQAVTIHQVRRGLIYYLIL